jgi:putative flippase GtrA
MSAEYIGRAVVERSRGGESRGASMIAGGSEPGSIPWKSRVSKVFRAALAGGAATAADVATLTLLVSAFGVDPHYANLPALLVGGILGFFGNRHFVFRAGAGDPKRQFAGYVIVEGIGLLLSGLLFDLALRYVPHARDFYVPLRLVSGTVVFLAWSFPLWNRVFRVPASGATDSEPTEAGGLAISTPESRPQARRAPIPSEQCAPQ